MMSDLDVEDSEQRILSCAVEHWREDFTGMSSSAIANRLTISHEIVLRLIDELERQGKGSVKREVGVPPPAPSTNGQVSSASKAITPSIFFPSPGVLAERFYADNLDRKGIPEYKARLHKGYSQIHLVYFDPEVLRRYRDHPDTYDIGDSVSGGHLFLSPDRTPLVRQEDQVDDAFPVITFGRRHLANGKELISVILYDLSELPMKEQAHWRSYEADDPKFAAVDPDFANFLKRDFDAEWVEDNDPLHLVLAEIARANAVVGEDGLFSVMANDYLYYPLVDSYKSLCDSCSELYKIVGPDSLREGTLRRLLAANFGYKQEDFSHPESGKPLGKLDLLKHLCRKLGCEELTAAIDQIKKHRVGSAHRVILRQDADMNHIAEFRRLAEQLQRSLSKFSTQIERLITSKAEQAL